MLVMCWSSTHLPRSGHPVPLAWVQVRVWVHNVLTHTCTPAIPVPMTHTGQRYPCYSLIVEHIELVLVWKCHCRSQGGKLASKLLSSHLFQMVYASQFHCISALDKLRASILFLLSYLLQAVICHIQCA